MLDVNAGIPLVDEPELLKSMLRAAQDAVDAPICIDSSVIEALEAGLSVYEGRALVNSVTAEDERLEEILPLVARHGAAVIGLANDETGIPETPREAARVRAQDRQRRRRPRDRDRGRDHRPAGDDGRRRHRGGDDDAAHDQPDPRRARREHVPRRLERLVRPAPAPRAERRLPADGDGSRADERDHVDRGGVRRGRARLRPAARPRRVGRELDRRAPRAPGGGGARPA